jgi:hypothetical protein
MAKARTTRTLNPLPFQDLEPHRFEDLVRQLAYDFREWRSIEAIGRTGSDGGMDIRAFEKIGLKSQDLEEEGEENEADPKGPSETRLWVIQCKREKVLGPAKVAAIVGGFFEKQERPYGYILAGIFFPRPEITLPIELKRKLYDMLSRDVARQLKRRKVSENDVLEDFEASRKKRRATRRRR